MQQKLLVTYSKNKDNFLENIIEVKYNLSMSSRKVGLTCQNCKRTNYSKVKSSVEKRLVIKKFCKNCNASTIHKEEKQ